MMISHPARSPTLSNLGDLIRAPLERIRSARFKKRLEAAVMAEGPMDVLKQIPPKPRNIRYACGLISSFESESARAAILYVMEASAQADVSPAVPALSANLRRNDSSIRLMSAMAMRKMLESLDPESLRIVQRAVSMFPSSDIFVFQSRYEPVQATRIAGVLLDIVRELDAMRGVKSFIEPALAALAGAPEPPPNVIPLFGRT